MAANDTADLYQIAATIRFPAGQYEIDRIEAGGGLGGPEESFFVGDVTEPGKLDFAYTRRFLGPGRNGRIQLISFRANFQGAFSLDDFAVADAPADLVVRDGSKQAITMQLPGGAQ